MNDTLSAGYFNVKQVAEILQVHRQSVIKYCLKGWLKHERTSGGHRRIANAAVLDFAAKRRRDSEAVNGRLATFLSSCGACCGKTGASISTGESSRTYAIGGTE